MSSEVERLADAVKTWMQARLGQAERAAPAEPIDGPPVAAPSGDGGAPSARRRPWPLRAAEAATPAPGGAPVEVARMIDHTLLRADATHDDIVALCDEARQHHFASVCVNGHWVPLCAARLAGSDVTVCTVVGFPLGATAAAAKALEAREAVRHGAGEVDMVLNVGALKSRDYQTVFDDIAGVVDAAAPARVKVILETSALERDEKVIACSLAKAAGAAFVKTSTGFGKGGATADDVALMRAVVGPELGVKASGGVRTAADAAKMIAAGADRLGTSAGVAIVAGGLDAAAAPGY
jgi:deoxyribose-phosphate aldolase